jgi:hypothetical protein
MRMIRICIARVFHVKHAIKLVAAYMLICLYSNGKKAAIILIAADFYFAVKWSFTWKALQLYGVILSFHFDFFRISRKIGSSKSLASSNAV